jgi:hypothetical protein
VTMTTIGARARAIGRRAGGLAITAGIVVAVAGGAAVTGHARPLSGARAPVWVVHPLAVTPGLPTRFVLDPSGAKLCWIALRGPKTGQTTGWRFAANGHRLELILLTHADGMPGRWQLRADCKGQTGHLSSATTAVTASPGSGEGLLAAHNDMRVSVLPRPPAKPDPILGLWGCPVCHKDAVDVYLWVAAPSGYEMQTAKAGAGAGGCAIRSGEALWRLSRIGNNSYRFVTRSWAEGSCTPSWSVQPFTVKITVAKGNLTLSCSDRPQESCYHFLRYTG